MNRYWMLTLLFGLGWASLLAPSIGAQEAVASGGQLRESAERAHREIWRRFVSPDGWLFKYTDATGRVFVPTPQECAENKPNALGYFTPIEDGAFYTGLYLEGLCNRWHAIRAPEDGEKARKVARGLLKLAAVGQHPAFVARGLATDGRAHYKASSSDQTFPWFYGLWCYATSGIPSAEERQQVVSVMERVALGLEANGWKIYGDPKEFGVFGDWTGGWPEETDGTRAALTGEEPQFDSSVRPLFVTRTLYQLTGKERWLRAYRKMLHEKPRGSSRTRLRICAEGVDYVPPGVPAKYPKSPRILTSASSQAALRALSELETDSEIQGAFRRGLTANATSAAPHIAAFRKYDNDNTLSFEIDWHFLLEAWKPQSTIAEAIDVARQESRLVARHRPRHRMETEFMAAPLFAAWIVAQSGNSEIIESVRRELDAILTYYRPETLYTVPFFMIENVYWLLHSPAKAGR
ncbi:MAG: hypothetical protein KatS3mg109_1939 [Pirellulaceae bacterium]|nr:MAG: hypothetical protein KatS3mg109_1939 [Pirellulaceae bacterium]